MSASIYWKNGRYYDTDDGPYVQIDSTQETRIFAHEVFAGEADCTVGGRKFVFLVKPKKKCPQPADRSSRFSTIMDDLTIASRNYDFEEAEAEGEPEEPHETSVSNASISIFFICLRKARR